MYKCKTKLKNDKKVQSDDSYRHTSYNYILFKLQFKIVYFQFLTLEIIFLIVAFLVCSYITLYYISTLVTQLCLKLYIKSIRVTLYKNVIKRSKMLQHVFRNKLRDD